MGGDSYFENKTIYTIDENNSLSFGTRRNQN